MQDAETASFLDEWDVAVAALRFRAEDLERPADLYAETTFLRDLTAKRSQVVFGRRGTGKTHLLLSVLELYRQNFDDWNAVPVLVNGQQLRDNLVGTMKVPQLRAIQLYVSLLRVVSEGLRDFVLNRLDPGLLDRIFGGSETTAKRSAVLAATELSDLLEAGEVVFLPHGETSEDVTRLQELEEAVGAGIGVKATTSLLDPNNIGLNLGASYNFKSAETEKVTRAQHRVGSIVLPLAGVGALVERLLNALGDSDLVVLIDEWSEVDFQFAVQPLLLEMIRRTVAGAPRIKVKLACIPTRTRLSAQPEDADIPIGMSIPDDIVVNSRLDDVVYIDNDLEQLVPFFLALAHLHLGASSDYMRELSHEGFLQALLTSAFESEAAFLELCQASGAVPRDFLVLLRSATDKRQASNANGITMVHVRLAALELVKDVQNEVRQRRLGLQSLALFAWLYRYYVAPNHTYFLSVSDTVFTDHRIQALWDARLLHLMPWERYDPDTFTTLRLLQVHYGLCVRQRMDDAARDAKLAPRSWSCRVPGEEPVKWTELSQEGGWLSSLASFAATVAAASARLLEPTMARFRVLSDERAAELVPVHVGDDDFRNAPNEPPRSATATD